MPAGMNFLQDRPRDSGILACRNLARRIDKIEKMMRGPGPLLRTRFGRPHLKLPVHRDGIAVDDLASKSLRQRQRQCCFPAGGWTENDHQQRLFGCAHRVQRMFQ